MESTFEYIDQVYERLSTMSMPRSEIVESITTKLSQYAYTEGVEQSDQGHTSTPMSQRIDGSTKRKAVSPLADLYKILDRNLDDNTETVSKLIKALEMRIDDMESAMQSQCDDIQTLTAANKSMVARSRVNEGLLTRQDKVIEDLREDLLQANARAMKDNIVFQNILETHDENVKETLHSFLKNDMKMSTPALDQVRISRIYRQGAARTNKSYPRQIVAKINDDGRQAIWKHTRNLSGSKFRVFTQLPRELAERKRQLIPQYNAAKSKKIPVKWAAEKLVVNG